MKRVRLTNKTGTATYFIVPNHGNPDVVYIDDYIRLNDCKGNEIYVNDVLYDENLGTYYTVFEVAGGYAIEGNPESFGIHDPNDPFPVYESTGDAQTSSYIKSCCKIIGTTYNKILMNKIKSIYERKKEDRKKTKK